VKDGWTVVSLADVAKITSGGSLKLSGRDFVESGVPAWGAGGHNGYVPVSESEGPAVILSSIGARCGKCFYVDGEWTTLANTQIIDPRPERVDARFLWYQLNDERRWPRSGSGQPFIKPSDVKGHQVVLPPLDEQRRIAQVLDAANTLRRQRESSVQLVDQLRRAVFLSTTLHPEDSWPVGAVADLADDSSGGIRTGPFGSHLLHSEFVNEGVAVLGIDNAVANEFRWGAERYITHTKYQTLRRYTVHPGDVLITIMGTCGRVAVVPDDVGLAINTKHLCCISLDRTKCLPEFLHAYFLEHPSARQFLMARAKGAIMAGLNMAIIKELPVCLPPMKVQRQLASHLAEVDRLREHATEHKRELDVLFSSLRYRAFNGEL
jgi:type I restriction enzyme, S subunit